ncbi:MAG: hypothetical protein Q7S09_04320 [bacterium]|nr:hypothetical protein [bacterium]
MHYEKDILGELFDSPVKVKSLKLFLRNPNEAFSIKDGARRLRVASSELARQIKKFLAIDLIRTRTIRTTKKIKRRVRIKKETIYHINPHFAFFNELRSLVLKSSPTAWDKKIDAIKKLGRVKLAVIAGHLLNDEKARLDVLVVGDALHAKSVASFMRGLEADVGKELRYAVLLAQEFIYRYGMYDNFLRDIFERPHKKLINKMKNIVGD